jgi:hypothetical protein
LAIQKVFNSSPIYLLTTVPQANIQALSILAASPLKWWRARLV